MGVESGAYKIKPLLFLFAVGLLAATKKLFKRENTVSFDLKKNAPNNHEYNLKG